MRAGLCTVSGPLAACSPAAVLPPSARFLALHLLHQQTLYFVVQAKSRVRELYQQTCVHFSQQGMLDTDLFGLALICDGEYLFADLDSKLSKYAPKSWRSSHSHGLDANGRPALAFYFRVQFYVDSPLLLRDESTRQHYYLQLRLNTSSGTATPPTTIAAIQLAALALQADHGDLQHQPAKDDVTTTTTTTTTTSTTPPSFRPEDYVPPNLRDVATVRAIETAHRSHRGLSKTEARNRFIMDACQLEESINAHVFRLRATKTELSPGTIVVAVCARGLRVCPENNPPSIFLWSSIGKLSFERKKFEIRTSHEKLTLYTSSDEKSRLLLSLCRATHQFSMAVAPRLTEARREEEEQRQRTWDGSNQRVSVISSTSSNTTSGIVSDRVHSEDELEIMITSPPAPSTESLALAHLLDSAPASSRTSAASTSRTEPSIIPLTSASTANANDGLDAVSIGCPPMEANTAAKTSTTVDGPLSRKPIRCTTSSQCSSSCSTVVVTPIQIKVKGGGRRLSTSSSLELGYSHTAQNSAISESTCVELAASGSCTEEEEPVYTVAPSSSLTSGVYTLTSSDQYTLGSTVSTKEEEEDDDCPNSKLSTQGEGGAGEGGSDQVDSPTAVTLPPFRQRRNSTVSNSGSFHGDGSDPTDTHDTLLTAEELSDLIVGRYPSRKSVGNMLDSDSDYVTLPRPPPPPYPGTTTTTVTTSTTASPSTKKNAQPIGEEVTARFVTTQSPNVLTAQVSAIGAALPSYTQVPPVPPRDTTAKKPPPPPPPSLRQPPPPPPPPHTTSSSTTVYTSQLSRSQIEQYQQQMYSDVDFVVFPLKEPAISQQEYLDVKQGAQMLAAALAPPAPPNAAALLYRSSSTTPYLRRYSTSSSVTLSSTQNLSDTYVQLPVYEAPPPPPPPPPPLPPLPRPHQHHHHHHAIHSSHSQQHNSNLGRFWRARSDDNILNSTAKSSISTKRPPPPPPTILTPSPVTPPASNPTNSSLDIRTLREKSKKMDLPLISALCNDRSLIKQTKAFVMPRHPGGGGGGGGGFDATQHSVRVSGSRDKLYPVSGLSANKLAALTNGKQRSSGQTISGTSTPTTTTGSHRHPGDKLPEIPRATPNNYVFTGPRSTKHISGKSTAK